ncbi:hypothetical protein [Croceiramulus getboli]|nr:hypothetical protein P8624_06790 [Flavobacteriaceae bacterium YJPT1-3]
MISLAYQKQWTPWNKVLLRFLILYFGMYILFRFTGSLLFESFLVWVGETVLQVDGRLEFFPTGSGDTTMAYVALFVQTAIAVLGTVIWTVLDRKRSSYNKLYYWFTVVLRIFLIFFLLSYGFAKIYKSQFPNPSLVRLLQPIGDMSPMGLAWTYMGHSEGFNLFVGLFEALGGILLIPRRTQLLGALVSMVVLFQIVLINFFYDVPVKPFSLHLFLMAAFLFAADAKRFIRFFIRNKQVESITYYHPVGNKTYHKSIFWFKIIAASLVLSLMSYQGYLGERSPYGDKREKPPLYGIWEVETFIKNGDTIPPLVTDDQRWRYLVIDWKDRAMVIYMTGKKDYVDFKVENDFSSVYLKNYNWKSEYDFRMIHDEDSLRLEGKLIGNDYIISVKEKDLKDFELINRGFHWVNEYPYNR